MALQIAYIDTEGTFRPELVKSIAAKWGLDEEGVLGNVAVARAYTNEHLSGQRRLAASAAARVGHAAIYTHSACCGCIIVGTLRTQACEQAAFMYVRACAPPPPSHSPSADLLVSLTAMMAEQACFKMLIVDSIMALYRYMSTLPCPAGG